MKISKQRLQEIVLEEMKGLEEAAYGRGEVQALTPPSEYMKGRDIGSRSTPGAKLTPKPKPKPEDQDAIGKRIQDITARMTRALPAQLATIDDVNEVLPFIVEIFELLQELNPTDLTGSEMQRIIALLRTNVLPDMQRNVGK